MGSCTNDTDPMDVSINGDTTRHCEDECNGDLEDEELEVDDDENDERRRKHEYENQVQYFDDSSGTRASPSPTAVRDTEDMSPPVIPKPLPHLGVTLGGLHQPAAATGPHCWNFPPGLASQFAWLPVYRPASPSSE